MKTITPADLLNALQSEVARGWKVEIRPDSIPDSMIVVAERMKNQDLKVMTNAFLIDTTREDVDGMKPLHYTLALLLENILEANISHFSETPTHVG